MPRSLTVTHTEKPGTSSLFNAFLLLCGAWLAVSMLVAAANADATATEASPAQFILE